MYPKDPKFIVAILEDHSNGDDPHKVENVLCVINVEKPDDEPKPIVNTDPTLDLYGPPAFSPKGTHIAWQHWICKKMPWDEAKIYIAEIKIVSSSFTLDGVRTVPFDSQGVPEVSLAYPNWSNDNTLLFTSDVSGFINPWKYVVSDKSSSAVFSEKVDKDFGYPMWSLHFFPFAVLDEKLALFIGTEDGHDSLYSVNLVAPGLPKKMETGCVVIDGLRRLENRKVVFAGTKVDEETKLVYYPVDVSHSASATDLESANSEKDWISTPIPSAIKGNDGDVYVVHYKPKNPNYSGPSDKKPPCIVHVHGGPEWLQPQGLDWTKQYFTSRGWAWYLSLFPYRLYRTN